MTWSEFKAAVEAQGVTDEMEIEYIDVGYGDSSVSIRPATDPEVLSINPHAKTFNVT